MQNIIVEGHGKCPKLPWMIEFHSTGDKILNHQLEAAYAENFLEHLSKLNEKSKVRRKRLTQFSVVIPRNVSVEHIEEFLKAGMTTALLKMDIFTVEEFHETVELIKTVNEGFGKKIGRVYPLAIAVDISEQEIITGKLQKPGKDIELKKGEKTNLWCNRDYANQVSKDYIYVNYDKLSEIVKPGDSILLGDDNVKLSALEVARDIVNCLIERAGLLSDNLSVKLPNIPTLPLPNSESFEKLTKIREQSDVDIIFVGPAKIDRAKEIFGPSVLVFVKIEYASTVDAFDEIAHKADGLLIDCEKLMVTSKERIFILQKSIIARCNKLAKPIVATINCHSITKAQVNDIANTVIDGIDGLLLPPDPDLLETITLICKTAESSIYQKELFENISHMKKPPIEPIMSVAIAAVEASFKSNAAAIILLTTTGRSAKLISMFRPVCPIIALTRFGRIAKQLMIYKGIIPIFYVQKGGDSFHENIERNMQLGMTFGKLNGYIRMGDAVVIVFGTKNNVGFRNCMEVVFASEYDTIPEDNLTSMHHMLQ